MNVDGKKSASFLIFRGEIFSVDSLEKSYGLSLPPIFKSFITQFEGIRGDIYRSNDDEYCTLTYYIYKSQALGGKNLYFEDFISIEDTFKYYRNSELWIENELLPITEHSHGGTILIGVGKNNEDKLFFEYDSAPVFIEHNIYSFLRNIDLIMDYKGSKNSIYKNWGEDFWRVKED